MKLANAVSKKILKICNERKISINKLATMCDMTQSTIQSLFYEKSKNPKLLTIVRICEGLDMPLKDFFDDSLFDDLERED